MQTRISAWFLLFLATPSLLQASPCTDVTNQIHQDTQKYAATIQNQHLPWMNLTWLQQKLGKAELTKISDTQTQHEWQCPNGADDTLTVLADKTGIISVNGKFTSEESAGLFSACLSTNCAANATPLPIVSTAAIQVPISQTADDRARDRP
jgi:hypothetical protein